jgi:ribosomal protein S12 methylthiotransferase accessory factor
MTRQQERYESAKRLCALSPDYLFEYFGITRVGEITDLDSIGVPVWSATRPLSHSISVSAGKSRDSFMAKAGAIAEAIEVALFESPEPYDSKAAYPLSKLKTFGFPMAASAKEDWYEIEQEPVLHYKSGHEILFPSDLVWLDHRANSPFLRSSNGQALGATPEEAILQGLYECIERDAMSLWELLQKEERISPPLIDLSNAPDSIGILAHKIDRAGLAVFVERITLDILLPIYCAYLLDPSESHASFMGYGTSIFDCVAVEKAILEAIQGRAVYIAGARDDITLGRYDQAKRAQQRALISRYTLTQPKLKVDWSSYDATTLEELEWAIYDIGPWAGNMFVKTLGADFPAAKVFIVGLDPPPMQDWQSVRWKKLRDSKDFNLLRPNSVRM